MTAHSTEHGTDNLLTAPSYAVGNFWQEERSLGRFLIISSLISSLN